jgi:hypothetical protein
VDSGPDQAFLGWGGDVDEMQAAWMEAMVYVCATEAEVFDPQAGQDFTSLEAL